MCVAVAFPYTAVQTVVFTIIGKFDQTADVDIVSIITVAFFTGQGKEIFGKFRSASLDDGHRVFSGQGVYFMQLIDQIF